MAQKKYTDGSGVGEIWTNTKNYIAAQLLGKSNTGHTHTKSEITDFPSYGTTAGTICQGNDSRLSDARTPTAHTHNASDITSGLATVATSGSYNDLSNKPTIPTVNNATLAIQKNGTTVKTFTANASSNVTANITVPTKTSDLTNDSGFLTSHQSLSNYSTLANTIKSLSISGKTITYTKGDNTTGTLTTQDNNTWTAMVGATSSSNGSVGYVNAVPPKDGYNTKYLRADGTWQVPPDHTYTVNNATLTIQKNGNNVATFTANASSNVTANITVPTVNNATLTIQKNGTNVATFTSNASSNATANITVPTKVSQLTNDSGYITSTVNTLEMTGNPPYIDFHGSNSTRDYTSRIIEDGTANTGRLRLVAYYNSTTYQVEMYKNFFEPVLDNDIYLGDSLNRWKVIYAATGTINTSDSRLKNSIKDIDDKLLDAWGNIEPKQYKFNDATEEKGEKARFHTGYLAQDIQTECEKQGINASDYGLFCYDEWEEQEEILNEIETEKDGKKVKEKRIIQPKRKKGNIFALRYEEALVVECAYLRKKLKELTVRIEELEKGNNSK